MIDNNKIIEVQLVSGTVSPNQMHLTFADVFADIINFGAVAAITGLCD